MKARRARKPAVDRAVATAQGHGLKPPQRRLRIWKWRPVGSRGSLAGFISVEFGIGLRIPDLPVFRSGIAGPWVGMPRVPMLDREKRQMRGEKGELLFEAAMEWRDRATHDAFSRAALQLLLAKWPDALDVRPVSQPARQPVEPAHEALL